jgi:membrane protein YdbS with pleckstrin-like domain
MASAVTAAEDRSANPVRGMTIDGSLQWSRLLGVETMHHHDDSHLVPVDAARIHEIRRPDDSLWTLYLIYACLSTVALPVVILPLYFKYKTLRYRFDEEGVAVSYGLIWRQETYLTYARIQDIHVTRNIFERWLGLGTVEVQTASGKASATESIVGVREFNEIRNFLYAHMRGHRRLDNDGAGDRAPLDVVLLGIRDELRAVRTMLEERHHV